MQLKSEFQLFQKWISFYAVLKMNNFKNVWIVQTLNQMFESKMFEKKCMWWAHFPKNENPNESKFMHQQKLFKSKVYIFWKCMNLNIIFQAELLIISNPVIPLL